MNGELVFDPNQHNKEDIYQWMNENNARSARAFVAISESDLDDIYENYEENIDDSMDIVHMVNNTTDDREESLLRAHLYTTMDGVKNAIRCSYFIYKEYPSSKRFEEAVKSMKSIQSYNRKATDLYKNQEHDFSDRLNLNLASSLCAYAKAFIRVAAIAKENDVRIESFVEAGPQMLTALWQAGPFART